MIFSNIPFEIPDKFAAGVATGDIRRIGAMLHDAGTGRVVAHVQETGALNALISNAGRLSPLGMLNSTSGIYGIVQNEQIKSRLDIMQGMMGSLQTLQLATLVSSIVGIGVTVASTAMILNRLRGLKTDLATIEEKVDRIPTDLRLNTLIDILVGIETHLERLDEASLRQDSSPVLRSAEEEMPLCFNRINERIMDLRKMGGWMLYGLKPYCVVLPCVDRCNPRLFLCSTIRRLYDVIVPACRSKSLSDWHYSCRGMSCSPSSDSRQKPHSGLPEMLLKPGGGFCQL